METPLSQTEQSMLTRVIMAAMRDLQGQRLSLPMVSAAVIANTMYQVEILNYPAVDFSYNVVFVLRTREWTLNIPAVMNMRTVKTDLGFEHSRLEKGEHSQLKHDLTLAAMFLE